MLSKGVQKYFQKTYGRKTVFIPNGVSKPEIREAKLITEQWGLTKDSYVLFLGRIVPEKGLRYLVEAWKSISTDKKLVIAGGSSDTEEFMNELKAMAGDDIIFTGFQQGRVLDELYSNAYIYTLPSDLEGMPLSLLEAMSYLIEMKCFKKFVKVDASGNPTEPDLATDESKIFMLDDWDNRFTPIGRFFAVIDGAICMTN